MTFSDLAAYTRELADLVGLRDWTVNLEIRDVESEEEFSGKQFVPWGAQRVDITLSPKWDTWSAEDLRVTLVHELVHCHLVRMMWSWNGALLDLAKDKHLRKALDRDFHTNHEMATETIATAWARALPLPVVTDGEDAA